MSQYSQHDDDATDATDVIQRLRARLTDDRRRRARRAGWSRCFVPTGLAVLDQALPGGGVPNGAITEILSEGPGVGAMALALRIAVAAMTGAVAEGQESRGGHGPPYGVRDDIRGPVDIGVPPLLSGVVSNAPRKTLLESGGTHCPRSFGRSVVLVDTFGDFYPPAAAQHGIDLDRLIVLRVRDRGQALWAVDQSIRCSAVAAVVASLGRLDEISSRRLQLAAESSGCLGLILLAAPRRWKSFSGVQMLIESVPMASCVQGAVHTQDLARTRNVARTPVAAHELPDCAVRRRRTTRITLLKVREGTPMGPLLVDGQDETGALCIPSVPADGSIAQIG